MNCVSMALSTASAAMSFTAQKPPDSKKDASGAREQANDTTAYKLQSRLLSTEAAQKGSGVLTRNIERLPVLESNMLTTSDRDAAERLLEALSPNKTAIEGDKSPQKYRDDGSGYRDHKKIEYVIILSAVIVIVGVVGIMQACE